MCDTKNPFLSRKKLFFQQKNLFLGEKLEKLSWNLETVKQKESMFVHVFNVFSLIFFLGEKLFSDHSFSGLFLKKFTEKKCFFLLLFRFHVWNWVKTYFLCVTPREIMVFHKKYFWFFFRWKEFVCETELKTLFQNLFSLSCVKSNWNQVKVSFSMCENKKTFFRQKNFFFFFMSENLFSMNKTNRTFVFPHVKPPTQNNFILRRKFFFFQKKKSLFSRKSLLCVKPR